MNVVVAMFPFQRGVARGRTAVGVSTEIMYSMMIKASFRGGAGGLLPLSPLEIVLGLGHNTRIVLRHTNNKELCLNITTITIELCLLITMNHKAILTARSDYL